jgi:hypothetical protein
MNFSDTQNLKKHWETITNLDAIEVNQDYAGFSGSMFYNSTETEQFKPCSWWARDDCKFPVAMSWYKPLSGRDARKSTMAVLLMNNGMSMYLPYCAVSVHHLNDIATPRDAAREFQPFQEVVRFCFVAGAASADLR